MKSIIVTGDSGALGEAIVRNILENTEYNVIGLSRRSNENILNKYQERYTHFFADLSNPELIKDLYINNIKPLGSIYGLVNNAAFAYDDIITNIHLEPLEQMFSVNVFSPMLLTKYAIRNMLTTGVKGSIVHISSVSAHTGYKGLAMYAATKGAIEAFSKTTAREWGSLGIRSNIVAPGFMETAISSKLNSEQKDKIYKRTSLKKATNIESVAKTTLFLLSNDSCSITGSIIPVDNGTI